MSESEVKKCPKCGREMEEGFISAEWISWIDKKPSARQQELIVHGFSFNTPAEAYRCKTCKIALFNYGPKRFPPSETPKSFLKKCVLCGKVIPIASDYCPNCGTKQKQNEE